MRQVVGTFAGRAALDAAGRLFAGAGYTDRELMLLSPPGGHEPVPVLAHRGESMLRAAVRWGILGALIVEVPSVITLLLLPVDINVKVLMAATVWKIGAAFGAWLGAAFAGEKGLDQEVAEAYQQHLAEGRWVLGADVQRRDRPFARGVMLESDAVDVRDVIGTFEIKGLRTPKRAPAS